MSKQRMKEGYVLTYQWLNRGEMEGHSWWESNYTFCSKLEDAKKIYENISTNKEGRYKNIKTHRFIKVYKVKEITFEDRD